MYKICFSMKLNKSPGIDGLPVEFYSTCLSHLDTFVFEVLINDFNNRYTKNWFNNINIQEK